MSEFDWCEQPGSAAAHVLIVDDAQHAVAALTAGASDYLVKPVDREMFLWRVRKALAIQRRRRNGIAESVSPAPRPAFFARRPERSVNGAANFAEGV